MQLVLTITLNVEVDPADVGLLEEAASLLFDGPLMDGQGDFLRWAHDRGLNALNSSLDRVDDAAELVAEDDDEIFFE